MWVQVWWEAGGGGVTSEWGIFLSMLSGVSPSTLVFFHLSSVDGLFNDYTKVNVILALSKLTVELFLCTPGLNFVAFDLGIAWLLVEQQFRNSLWDSKYIARNLKLCLLVWQWWWWLPWKCYSLSTWRNMYEEKIRLTAVKVNDRL